MEFEGDSEEIKDKLVKLINIFAEVHPTHADFSNVAYHKNVKGYYLHNINKNVNFKFGDHYPLVLRNTPFYYLYEEEIYELLAEEINIDAPDRYKKIINSNKLLSSSEDFVSIIGSVKNLISRNKCERKFHQKLKKFINKNHSLVSVLSQRNLDIKYLDMEAHELLNYEDLEIKKISTFSLKLSSFGSFKTSDDTYNFLSRFFEDTKIQNKNI